MVRYTGDQKLEVIKLFYRYHKDNGGIENYSDIMDRYNNTAHALLHPMTAALDVKRIITSLENSYLNPKQTKPETLQNSPAVQTNILASIQIQPHMSIRKRAASAGLSYGTMQRVMKNIKSFPYKQRRHQKLYDGDEENRIDFVDNMLPLIDGDPNMLMKIFFWDEATVFTNDPINRQNFRYWSTTNPHWLAPVKDRNAPKLNIGCGILGNEVVGPYFFNGNITGASYLKMLKEEIIPDLQILAQHQNIPFNEVWYQQDGAPAHYSLIVRQFLQQTFPGRVIGRACDINWPARSPDLAPMDFFYWGYMRQMIFLGEEIKDIAELKHRCIAFTAQISPQMLENVRDGFKRRLWTIILVEGGHFEHMK